VVRSRRVSCSREFVPQACWPIAVPNQAMTVVAVLGPSTLPLSPMDPGVPKRYLPISIPDHSLWDLESFYSLAQDMRDTGKERAIASSIVV
jgi:hypothetical protein